MHMYTYSLHAHEQCMHDAQPATDLALEDMHWQGPRILALSTPAHITSRLTDNNCVDNTCQLQELCIYIGSTKAVRVQRSWIRRDQKVSTKQLLRTVVDQSAALQQ